MLCEAQNTLDITVVTPTFNRAKLVTRALESVRSQFRPPASIIVVDDASSDGTPDVVRRWATETGFPVTVEVLQQNGGPAKARNRGIELANTEYVAFLDSDDEHLPNTLARLVAPLERLPDAVLSFADATVITPSDLEPHGLFRPHIDLDAATEPLFLDGLEVHALREATSTLLKASIIPTSGTCFRRHAALAAGLMPHDFRSGEDWLFWLRLAGQGRFVFQLDDLVRHHRHDDNLTHPRASEFIAREKLRGFLALLDGSMRVSLTPEETNRARRLAKQCQANWLYHLSRLGMRPYLSGLQSDVGKQIGGGYGRILSDPRSFLRSIACSLLRP